jgi:hypothetical protein
MTTDSLTIDSDDDDPYIPLDDASRHIPGRPHRATIWRWASRGVIRHGQPVRLMTIISGGRRMTTRAWIDSFLSALNAGEPSHQPSPTAVRARRQRQAQAAMEALQSR